MTTVHFVLLLLALVCFLVAAIATATGANTGRLNLIALGLAFWVSTLLVPR